MRVLLTSPLSLVQLRRSAARRPSARALFFFLHPRTAMEAP